MIRQMMNKKDIEEFFSRLAKKNPHPKTELKFASNFQLLVSVILSAQATDVSVNKATEKLYQIAPDASSMSKLTIKEISSYISTIGLHKNKAVFVKKTTEEILSVYGGVVPNERSQLEALPGVGRKTANVVLNIAFGEHTIAVDTHIFRVANRTFLAAGNTPLEVEKGLNRKTPPKYKKNAHHWLLLHGRHVCKSRTPICYGCLVSDLCNWSAKGKYL